MALSVEEKATLTVGVVTAGFLGFFIIYAVAIYKKGKKAIQKVKGELELSSTTPPSPNSEEGQDSNDSKPKSSSSSSSSREEEALDLQIPRDFVKYIEYGSRRGYLGVLITSILVSVFIELLLLVLVMFDKLNVAAGIVLMVGYMFFYYTCFIIPSKKKWIRQTLYSSLLQKWGRRLSLKITNAFSLTAYWIGFVALVVIIIVLNIALEGVCEENLKLVNTRLTRRYMESTCSEGPPCLLYLTLTETPDTSVLINFHTAYEKRSWVPKCYYTDIPDTLVTKAPHNGIKVIPKTFDMNIEVTRQINFVLLDNLRANSVYYFTCGSDEGGYTKVNSFKTQTNDSSANYNFVVGGDIDITETAYQVNQLAAAQNPQFSMLGGDLAYDRAQLTCYRTLDKWISNYQNAMVSAAGYMIPMIATIGNHEVVGDFSASYSRVPFFMKYFPQRKVDFENFVTDDNGLPLNRVSYGSVNIGGPNGTIIFNLDSGHHTSMSLQKDYMQSILSNTTTTSNYTIKFSIYHVPMYPTIRTYENSHSTAVRQNWLNFFDENRFTVGFENHDHVYKRTMPMVNGVYNEQGTIYIGDGAWGVGTRPIPYSTKRFYQEFTKGTNYITSVSVNPLNNTLSFQSIDMDNQVFDSGVVQLK